MANYKSIGAVCHPMLIFPVKQGIWRGGFAVALHHAVRHAVFVGIRLKARAGCQVGNGRGGGIGV